MELNKYLACSRAARKLVPADLVLRNAKIVNVFTDRVEEGNIAITRGMIVGIGDYQGKEEIDLQGQYVTSGFIDAHLHLESTLVNPQVLISKAEAHGTTTFIVDPHEVANVAGPDGIDYLLSQTESLPAHVYVMIASCVPATPIDDNGYRLTAIEMKKYLSNHRVLGLGEVMDCMSVINGDPYMNEKLELFDGKVKDGHAPNLTEEELAAYVMAGVTTDHEGTTYEYVMKERAIGMTCHIREGSAARNLEMIVKGIVENNTNTEGFCFCTDDKHIEDITREGDIDHNVRKAVSMGISPIAAIKMATIQPARCYGLRRTGAVAPGYDADLVVWDSLKDFNAQMVFYKGQLVDENQKIRQAPCPAHLMDTIHLGNIDLEDLKIRRTKEPVPVIGMIPGQILTERKDMVLPGSDFFEPNGELDKIAVFERHKATGKTGVGAVLNFGLRGGAIASSVSHDSHNIIVIGDNDRDILLAVRELERARGGYTIIENGEVYDTLELPIMGLISDKSYSYVNRKLKKMIRHAHKMGVPDGFDPFITLSFMALPVIPEIRCTPRGMYSVTENCFLT
uniref:Adenine deaminase n=1 Tax=Eubacterium cellulosolvens (strain ATCC 43171 / JCM 9499 / 6) TaxID=633697 RepID=I5ATB7_EUBC6